MWLDTEMVWLALRSGWLGRPVVFSDAASHLYLTIEVLLMLPPATNARIGGTLRERNPLDCIPTLMPVLSIKKLQRTPRILVNGCSATEMGSGMTILICGSVKNNFSLPIPPRVDYITRAVEPLFLWPKFNALYALGRFAQKIRCLGHSGGCGIGRIPYKSCC